MRPLQVIYWSRLGLGVVAALLCTGYVVATGEVTTTSFNYTTFINSMSIALAVYLVSYYAIKMKFLTRVEKPTKLMTMGIGIYFIAWLVFWVLLYTMLAWMYGV
jgi:hypothetical protein